MKYLKKDFAEGELCTFLKGVSKLNSLAEVAYSVWCGLTTNDKERICFRWMGR
jgi:hypothetical protein